MAFQQPSHSLPPSLWWRCLFVNYPGYDTGAPEAFAGAGKARGKVKVSCRSCIEAEVDKIMSAEPTQFIIEGTECVRNRAVVYNQVLNSPHIKWIACRVSNCLVHLRKCQTQPLEVRFLAETEQASRNAVRRAKRNGAQVSSPRTLHGVPLPRGHAPEPYQVQNQVREPLPNGEPSPFSHRNSPVCLPVDNSLLAAYHNLYPGAPVFTEQNTNLCYTRPAPRTIYIPQAWNDADYALPCRHMVPSFDGTNGRGMVSTLPPIRPTSESLLTGSQPITRSRLCDVCNACMRTDGSNVWESLSPSGDVGTSKGRMSQDVVLPNIFPNMEAAGNGGYTPTDSASKPHLDEVAGLSLYMSSDIQSCPDRWAGCCGY